MDTNPDDEEDPILKLLMSNSDFRKSITGALRESLSSYSLQKQFNAQAKMQNMLIKEKQENEVDKVEKALMQRSDAPQHRKS